jgi:XTP/dITP diphosphohydrolase
VHEADRRVTALGIPRLVLASGNAGKLREFHRLLAPLGIEVIAQSELGIPEADEPYSTFVENALAKARNACARTKLPALADDSGICVRALGGAPGVHSAYYAGAAKDDSRNNAKLIAALAGIADRRAHYACVLTLLRHEHDPEPIVAEGAWHGTIIDEPRGRGGFGYDPHFLDAETGMTGAELPLERKNELSHRGKAIRALIARLVVDATDLTGPRSGHASGNG